MGQPSRFNGFRVMSLVPATVLTTAVTNVEGTVFTDLLGMQVLAVQAALVYGSGGTSIDVYIQTSFDGGTTWVDIMQFAFTTASATRISSCRSLTAVAANYTPTMGTLTASTIKDGLLGTSVRAYYSSVGTYAGATTLTVIGTSKGGW